MLGKYLFQEKNDGYIEFKQVYLPLLLSYVCIADILRLKSVSVGVVVIKGELTGRYLAMNKNGGLYGSVSVPLNYCQLLLILGGKIKLLEYHTTAQMLIDVS